MVQMVEESTPNFPVGFFNIYMQVIAGSDGHRFRRGATCSLYLTARSYTNGGVDGRLLCHVTRA